MGEKVRPSLSFTLLCDDVRQELGGKISLMGIFENIYAVAFPAVHPRLAIVNEWADGKGEFLATLRILSPDKRLVIRENMTRLKFANAACRQRDVTINLNIEFREPGIYWIENYLDGLMVNSIPLHVMVLKEKSFN